MELRVLMNGVTVDHNGDVYRPEHSWHKVEFGRAGAKHGDLAVKVVHDDLFTMSNAIDVMQTTDARLQLAWLKTQDFAKEGLRSTVHHLFGANIGSMLTSPPRTEKQLRRDQKNAINAYVIQKYEM